jgi:hypothetical protein
MGVAKKKSRTKSEEIIPQPMLPGACPPRRRKKKAAKKKAPKK